MERLQAGDQQELRVIVKADVHGSGEALNSAFNKLTSEKVKLSIVHSGVGAIGRLPKVLDDALTATPVPRS